MKLLASIALRVFLAIIANALVVLSTCQIDENTIQDGYCFINNECINSGDKRRAKDISGSVITISQCQICNPTQSQTIWSITSGFLAATDDPPNDCASVPTDTYRSCEVPSFEWAAFSTRSTARMYPMKGSLSGDHLFAAGFIKSTVDAADVNAVQTATDFSVSGPYSTTDPEGNNAKEISVDLTSYSAADGAGENAGGSFGQYEVGVVKVDITTGEPQDVFVFGGHGLDETSGIVASNGMLAISGHFTGNLTAEMTDGTLSTIVNSNLMEDGTPNQADQFHPNQKDASGDTGVDDGFVIKASADTGKAEWIVRYPTSNKDSQIVGVDMDSSGNVYGAGYQCTQELETAGSPKVCDGVIAKFAANDGTIVWEKIITDIGAALWIKYDGTDNALYFTGTTTFGGSSKDTKMHPSCTSETCAVINRISAEDGAIHWTRTVPGSPRYGVFDQSGDIELAPDTDGPYIYVAFDDVGEGGPVTLDSGSPYAGCKNNMSGIFAAEYVITTTETLLSTDCPDGFTFVSRSDEEAMPASSANTRAHCGSRARTDACLMKYHKYTGLPIWGADLPPVAGIVPSPDGKSIMTGGWYYNNRWGGVFDSIVLPGYLREGGLGSQRSGIYNAKLSAETGKGEFVLHSGGGSKDRLYDMVGDSSGNVYNVGYSMNLVMRWGGTLETKMVESDVEQSEAGTQANETHFYVSKLGASETLTPSCLSTCTATTDTATVKQDSCFIDGVCYGSGDSATLFGKGPCFVCDPAASQTEWTVGPSVGTSHCISDDICVKDGDFLFSQRRTWSAKTYSSCQYCDAAKTGYGWSVKDGFTVSDEGNSPPNDCDVVTAPVDPSKAAETNAAPTGVPSEAPISAPISDPISDPSTTSSSSKTSLEVAIAGIVIGTIGAFIGGDAVF